MSESIFHESTSQGITCVCVCMCVCVCVCMCVWRGGDASGFPQDERYGISFITITSVGVGKS